MTVRSGVRLRLTLQLGLLHVALAATAWMLWHRRPLAFAAAEVALLLSAAFSWRLVARVDLHRRLLREGRDLLHDEEFSARLRRVGVPEADELVDLFNAAIERLRKERIRSREQEAFLERLVEASPLAVLLLDLDGLVASINPAGTALLAPASNPTGLRVAELPAPFGPALAALRDDESTLISAQARRFKATRARFWDRGFARAFLLIAEVTEELRQSERDAWGRLVRIISHEVNNSTGAVASLLESCRAELVDPRAGVDVDAALAAGARRLTALESFVAGYAEVVRLPQPQPRPVELGRLLDELALVLGAELAQRRVRLSWERRDDAWIHADPNQIERVLVNIIRNAAEAIGEGGVVRLELASDPTTTDLTVTDDGPGLDPQTRERLFTPFYSTKRDGRGLGLTLVREILAAHHIDFSLEDAGGEPPRRGARFRMRCTTRPADSALAPIDATHPE